MNRVDALAQLTAQLVRGGGNLSVSGDADFSAKLTLGQIIKGRVLRSYDGGRHLVDFGGEPRVVDSAVPLRADEVFRGRVVGLGERVQLQKLADEAPAADRAPRPDTTRTQDDPGLQALFLRYRAEAPAAERESAAALTARLPQPAVAALAALVVAKLGLPLAASLIRATHARLVDGEVADPARLALQLETTSAGATQTAAAVPALAAALQQALAGAPGPGLAATASGSGQDDARQPRRDPAARLLNVQTGGAVAHRLGSVPLLVDGRLLELEIAFFDERPPPDPDRPAAPRHRQIVIALDTPALGHVEVRARVAGAHMEVELATTSSEQTLALSMHQARLQADLSALGFAVDRLAYLTQPPGTPSAPVQAVVEHLITPGSVSRWA